MNYQKNKKSFSLKFKRNKNPFVFLLLLSLFILQLQLVNNTALGDPPELGQEPHEHPHDEVKPPLKCEIGGIESITNKASCQSTADKMIEQCVKAELKESSLFTPQVDEEGKEVVDKEDEKTLQLTCPAHDFPLQVQDGAGNRTDVQATPSGYDDTRKEHVKNALDVLKDVLPKCVTEIRDTIDCCNDIGKCFGYETGLNATEMSVLMGALAGGATGGITALTNDNNAKAICDGLTAATAAAGFAQFGVGAVCVFKADNTCRGACNITESQNTKVLEGTTNAQQQTQTNYLRLEELFEDIHQLEVNLKDFCDTSARKGYTMLADSAILGTSAGLIAHHCEKIIGGDKGDKKDDSPEDILNRNKAYCDKTENAYKDFCNICKPDENISATEYNTNTLIRYPSCRDFPAQETLTETSYFPGRGGRSRNRTPNQGMRDPSQQPDPFSGYGRSGNSNLDTTTYQTSGPSGENSSIGTGGTTSSHSDSSSGEEDQNQVSAQTSDVGFSGAGGGGGSSGSYYSSRQSRSRWNLRDFLPGRKKDPKKKGSKSSRKKLLNVRSKQNSIFVTNSQIIHKFCSNKTLNRCQSNPK